MLLFYLVLIFGGLIFLYTLTLFVRTKNKIIPKEYTKNLRQELFNKFRQDAKLWVYYFVNGNKENLLRNSLLALLLFMVVIGINGQFVKFDPTIISIGYWLLFASAVWKLGRRRNRKDFENGFPEVIQVLNSAITAGAGLLQALSRCGKDIQGNLGKEFSYIYKRLAIGEDIATVLEDSYTRWPYKEFYYFVVIVRINLEKGGQMKEVINRLGRVIADSRKMEQKKRAMTSEARMSAMIVGAFPLVFFLFMKFQMPENFDFVINNPSGRIILYYVLGSELLGMGIIWGLMKKAA